jgi:hypothetical protein
MVLDKSLDQLVEAKCDIIICTSREKGKSVKTVEDLEKENYNIIWISSFQSEYFNHETLNRIAAENIIEIIKALITGQLKK